ncbi:MAG: MAPEG family protein [Paracoccaceae bacterium]
MENALQLNSPLYAGLIALLFLVLSFRVVLGRYSHKVSIGDGANEDMVKRMRVQANCAEYAPIGIILLVLAELQGMPVWAIHLAGIVLLGGRLLHAYGLGSTPQIVQARQWGMYFTIGMIMTMAISNVVLSLF